MSLEKEELFLTKYDLEKKLSDMSNALKTSKTYEVEVNIQLKNLQKKLDAKVSECESMVFRIKHMEDMSVMLEPPITS